MRRVTALLVAAAGTAIACAEPSAVSAPNDAPALTRLGVATHGGAGLDAVLTGANEVPGPGDPDGAGTARVTLNLGQGEVCYELTATRIAPATMAHIHRGPAGVAGPVVIPLVPPTSGSSTACTTATRDLIKAIRQDPAAYYDNVHNAPYPGGAIRGQLGK